MTARHTSLLVREKDVDRFKIIFDIIQKKHSHKPLTSPKVGKLGKDYLISLKFDDDFYRTAIETLVYNDMKILLPDENTKDIINRVKERRIQAAINSSIKIDERKPVRKKVSTEDVDEIVYFGNYESLINVSKNINNEKEVIEKAAGNIDACINRAIDIAVIEAKNDKALINRSIKRLIEIASDKKIKSLNKINLLKRAGFEAIELCATDWETIKDLINIANNNQLHNLVNIKSAIKFYEVAFGNRTKYKNEIDAAVKKLNIRWLTIVLDVVENSLTQYEKSQLDSLIDAIKIKR
ncbi:MAG: hypothetical protein HND52_03915 [Ignavibacteriae bacterium]|nr:hypothetical protein [Ignavibacteriota bacterium]NOG97102.1 hypothetical protein [Ignavibacteriota bacterium]